MLQRPEETTSILNRCLTGGEYDDYKKQLSDLPKILIDEMLHGIVIGNTPLRSKLLLLVTNKRIVVLQRFWGRTLEEYHASYDEIFTVTYDDHVLTITDSKRGSNTPYTFSLSSQKAPDYFLLALRKNLPSTVDYFGPNFFPDPVERTKEDALSKRAASHNEASKTVSEDTTSSVPANKPEGKEYEQDPNSISLERVNTTESGDITQSAEEITAVVHEQLSTEEIETYEKQIIELPVFLKEEALEAVAGGNIPGIGKVLVILTTGRILCLYQTGGFIHSYSDSSFDDIDTMTYEGERLTVRKKKGLLKITHIDLSTKTSTDSFLNIMRQRFPVLVDEGQPAKLSNKVQLTDQNLVSSEKSSAIDRALRTLTIMDARFLSRGEIKELPRILWEDELPEAVVSGRYHDGNGLLVATDRRLIFVDKGLVGLTVEDFYFEDISSIESHIGWMMGNVNIYARGNKENIEDVPKDMIRPFSDFLRNRLALAKQLKDPLPASHEQPTSSSVSVADELIKFTELLKDGILTEEEFNVQKRRLLDGD